MEPDPRALCIEITTRRSERFEREKRIFRQDHPRASSIGDCALEIYYAMIAWQLRPSPSPELLQRFRRGDEIEKIVTRELLIDGWDIVEQQMPFEIIEDDGSPTGLIICTGHADMRIAWNGSKPVADVKSLNPNVWERIDSAHDFRRMGSFWTKYPRQLLLYMYQHDEALGLFLLDDCLGHIKPIPMLLDDWLDECERALRTARAAAEGKRDGIPPDFCDQRDVCQECWCRKAAVCFPPMPPADVPRIIDDGMIAADVALLVEQTDQHKEYAKAERFIKAKFKGMGAGMYLVGECRVTVEVKGKGDKTYVTWARLPGATDAETPPAD